MRTLKELLENNRRWSQKIQQKDPEFFSKLSHIQKPGYLWIGCSDSRVPANEITGLLPGELFVHRNVANIVVHTDLNCLSVLQYAVDVLKVTDIIVCGHYGCGGVKSALDDVRLGLIDNWLRHVRDVMEKYESKLSAIKDARKRFDRICELNVVEQAVNVCQTTVVQEAWSRGQSISVHAFVYDIQDGLLRDLGFGVTQADEAAAACKKILKDL